MEVISKEIKPGSIGPTIERSSFDCDPITMDWLLGVGSRSDIKLRIDMPETPAKQESSETKVSQWEPPRHTEQLLRLLDRQQAWYDAQQQAARAAEQLLSLCEHHQQQWLQPIPQTQPATPQTQPATPTNRS